MSAPQLKDNWRRLLNNLLPDWDSYGAPRISEKAIDTLESFSVVPCSSGGLQLEVHRNGFDIEIEISPDGKIEDVLLIRDEGFINPPEANE